MWKQRLEPKENAETTHDSGGQRELISQERVIAGAGTSAGAGKGADERMGLGEAKTGGPS